jgi:hypothetical protein
VAVAGLAAAAIGIGVGLLARQIHTSGVSVASTISFPNAAEARDAVSSQWRNELRSSGATCRGLGSAAADGLKIKRVLARRGELFVTTHIDRRGALQVQLNQWVPKPLALINTLATLASRCRFILVEARTQNGQLDAEIGIANGHVYAWVDPVLLSSVAG